MNPSPLELLDLARNVGLEAAANIRQLRPAGRVEVASTKSSDTDAVTEIDRASEEFIRNTLLAARPEDTFIGEEGGHRSGTSSVSWLVDPIDGTVNFMYGIPAYAVSIAAVVDGEVVAGFVINVASGEAWGAARGDGAWRWAGPDGPAEVVVATPPPDAGIGHALVGTGFNYVPEVRARQAAAVARLLPQIRDVRRFGSAALDLCALASGRLDGYIEEGLQPWDLAAGALVARECGLEVVETDRLVMAAHPELATEFFELVDACGF